MAFGFSFNREKALASAEKFVQQGKLQNAISEYEKIIKEDPKDLTVLNTVGDLCARVGQNDQAAHYFKKAGDQYAQDGFTVKAIAIYKKLTRLNAGDIENVNKLAELYTQQGLISDARAQYMQVADHYLRAADNNQAARVLQRILELDPENTATKSKLADLYLKLGKKEDARNIYFTAAESLYARGSFDAAEEALDRVLKMDPANTAALLLRGKIAADSGDSASAARYFAQVPELDSRPDGLRALLHAKMQSDDAEGLEALASKLLTAHHDVSAVREVATWFVEHHRFAEGLRLYETHAATLMNVDRKTFQESLNPLIVRIKDNPEALAIMMRLLEKSQDSSHMAELTELQAHAFAQKGRYQEARDLYKKLSELEPENVLHQQNYKQMQSKLGEDPASRSLSPEEAAQAFMVEALEEAAPAVHQNYDPAVEKAIEAALTDAELFVSYNVPAKAIPPLEAVLPMAPRDVTVNQRLATLYARGGRYAEAAGCCERLSEIYRERGHDKEAAQYLEAAQSYSLRAPKPAASKVAEIPAAMGESDQPAIAIDLPAEPATPSVQEFSFDVPDHLSQTEPEPAHSGHTATASVQEIKIEPDADIQITPEAPGVAVAGNQQIQEVDVSSEWEDMLTVEGEAPTAIDVPAQPVGTFRPEPPPSAPPAQPADTAAEKIQEIQFYLDQEMWDLAKKAILDLTEIAPDAPEITKLISAVSAGQARTAAASPSPAGPPAVAAAAEFAIEVEAPKPAAPPVIAPPPAAKPAAPAARHQAKPAETPEFVIAPVAVSAKNEPVATVEESPLAEVLEQSKPAAAPPRKKAETKAPPPPAPVVPAPAEKRSPLEEVLETIAPPAAKPALPKKEEGKKPAKIAKQEKTTEDILSDFVGDLEKTDLADFSPQPKSPERTPVSAPAPKVAATPPSATSAPMAAAAAAPAPEKHAGNGNLRAAETTSMLSDILAELQEETVEASEEEGDTETHYNLGIAFKEMGLLDEAIGELQKVCHAVDRGKAFSQPIQAYTWLAQCLVDKGAPEAAVRWYQRALQLPVLDDGSRCAIYYDLAAAYEASGDNKSALANFMEVYGSNIDFRDVASRIKALKS